MIIILVDLTLSGHEVVILCYHFTQFGYLLTQPINYGCLNNVLLQGFRWCNSLTSF